MDKYGGLAGDEALALRIRVYRHILAVWCVARLARFLHEWARGSDERLTEKPKGWRADMEAKYGHYLGLAEQL